MPILADANPPGWPASAYDGETWTHHPEAWHVLGFGPDGVVWVEDTNQELLVIRPENDRTSVVESIEFLPAEE